MSLNKEQKQQSPLHLEAQEGEKPFLYFNEEKVYAGIKGINELVFEMHSLNSLAGGTAAGDAFSSFIKKNAKRLHKSISLFTHRLSIFPADESNNMTNEEARSLLAFNCSLHANDRICVENIPVLNATLIYAIDDTFIKFLENSKLLLNDFSSVTGHQLQLFNDKFRQSKNDDAVLHIAGNFLQIFIFRQGKMLFHNVFSYTSAEDIIYFTMHVFHTLGLNPDTAQLNLCGEIVKGSEAYKLCWKYIRHVAFFETNLNVYDADRQAYPRHLFYGVNSGFC